MNDVLVALIGVLFGCVAVAIPMAVFALLRARRKPQAPESAPVKPPTIEYRVSAPSAEQMQHFRSALERKAARDAANVAARAKLRR